MADHPYPKGEKLQRLIAQGKLDMNGCTHIEQILDVVPDGEGCQQCLDMGDTWVNLRICMICGQVGCCDNSKNKHATRHYHETGHPIIQSFEPEEEWLWCYDEEIFFEP